MNKQTWEWDRMKSPEIGKESHLYVCVHTYDNAVRVDTGSLFDYPAYIPAFLPSTLPNSTLVWRIISWIPLVGQLSRFFLTLANQNAPSLDSDSRTNGQSG